MTRAILVGYDVEGTPKLATLPSLPIRFQATPQFSPFSVVKVSIRSISMNVRHSSIHIVHLLNLSSLPSSTRSFNHLLPPPLGTSFFEHGLNVISWLSSAAPLPPVDYPASVPVSFPLIGLTQFSQHWLRPGCLVYHLPSF